MYNLNHDEEIRLHCIDANLSNTSFVSSLLAYAQYLFDNPIFTEYASAFPNSNSDNYIQSLQELQETLDEQPETLGFAPESESVEILLTMVQNEILSVPIRSGWNSDYARSFNDRESLIKGNADYYLRTSSRLLIFYFGANHVQKGMFLGSQIEWLGDYLHHANEISWGNIISIVGIPLMGEIINSSNSGTMQFDLHVDSKEDDLLRILSGIQSTTFGWLPLTDPIFSSEDIRVQYIYEGNEIIAPPKQQYDAFITFSTGTFVGW